MASVQVLLHPLTQANGSLDIEVSVPGTAISSYAVKLINPEPIAGFEKYLAKHVEQYTEEPFETQLAKRVGSAIEQYGRDLYNQLHLGGFMEKLRNVTGHIDEHTPTKLALCVLEEPESAVSGVHWELLESLSIQQLNPDFDIQVSRAANSAESTESGDTFDFQGTLNILVVVARPKGRSDIPYRNAILPVTNISNGFPSGVLCVDIVRQGTWEAVQKALDAKPSGHYQVVHFDVHGVAEESRAFLHFESTEKDVDEVGAEEIASTLAEHGVTAAILNACRSARKPGLAESSIASTLLSHVHKLQFVIGMSYNVDRDAVKYFLQGLYKALLLENQTISEAVSMGRKEMQQNPSRSGRFDIEVNVQDWFNPILYLRSPAAKRLRMASGQEGLAVLDDDWCSGFYDRDYDISRIEKALLDATIVSVQGFRGAGKSTLMNHLQEWWVRSNFVEAVFVVDFSETVEFTEDSPIIYPRDIFTQIDTILTERNRNSAEQRRVYSIGPTPSAGPRRDSHMDEGVTDLTEDFSLQLGINAPNLNDIISRLKAAFSQERHLILFNRLDRISSLAYGGPFNFHFWTEEMKRWLDGLDWLSGLSMALFSSLLVEEWLDDVPADIVELKGLDLSSATRYAHDIIDLHPYLRDPTSRLYLERIIQYYQCQPLALKVVLEHLRTSGLTAQQYFERTLCSEIELPLKDTQVEQKPLVMDFILTCMAAEAIPLPILSAMTAYCPRPYIMDILEGKGPFPAKENPSQAFEDDIKTLQDFAVAYYIESGSSATDSANHLHAGHLQLHPLFPSFIRGVGRKTGSFRGVKTIDITFAYLVDYLAQRSEYWDGIYGLQHPGGIEIERNWFNILAALRYCVSMPYNWEHATERLFDLIMNRIVVYAIDYKQEDMDIIAGIASRGISRIMKAFSHSSCITAAWWQHLHLSEEETAHGVKNVVGELLHMRKWKTFPLWLLVRILLLYSFLRLYAYRKFDPRAWDYNAAVIGLVNLKRQQGFQLGDGEAFLEQEAFVSAAEIAHQSSSHYVEGLGYLQKVDLSKVVEEMKEHLEVRKRDILAELMGYVMDAESYRSEAEVEKFIDATEAAERERSRPLSSNRPARALMTRRAYAKALRTKLEEDIGEAKRMIYKEKDSIKDPGDPYTIILYRFMGDLFMAESNWEDAIRQLRLVQEYIDSNPPGAFQSIIHGTGGRNSYLMELHQELAKCYRNLGNAEASDVHQQQCKRLYEEREKTWTHSDMEKEANINMIAAICYAIQTADLGGAPDGWTPQVFERVPVDLKSQDSAAQK